MPAPDPHPIEVALAIEFLEEPQIATCERCGNETLHVAMAVLTMNDAPQGGPALYSCCSICDLTDKFFPDA